MATELRKDEKFVIDSLCVFHGGNWHIGEDPPDVYWLVDCLKIAVEISRLTEQIVTDEGTLTPRLSDDEGVLRLSDELNDELKNNIPEEVYIILRIAAPIQKIRKFKDVLKEKIIEVVEGKSKKKLHNSLDKTVKIRVVSGERPSGKKIISIVENNRSSPYFEQNVYNMMSKAISEKTFKCKDIAQRPLHLALLNDYPADVSDYKFALEKLGMPHPFEKIFLISSEGNVETLYST